jgi:Tfp pilus assembly protein PilN
MPEKLNLLPQNLQISKSLEKILKAIRAFNVIFIVTFAIFCLGAGGFFIYSRLTLGNIQTNNTQLESQIKAQEDSEQKLILLKDRLAKISSIKSTPTSVKNTTNLGSLLVNMSPSTIMNKASVSPTGIEISFAVGSNEDLTALFQNIRSSTMFKLVDLSSFGYAAGAGYAVGLTLTTK